jgi:hypothetical protein
MSYTKQFQVRHGFRLETTTYLGIHRTSNDSYSVTSTKSGSAVPKYRSIIKSGGNAFSSYTLDDTLKFRVQAPIGYTCVTRDNQVPPVKYTEVVAGLTSGSAPSYPGFSTSVNAYAQALQRVHKRLQAEQTLAHGMQFVGELRETIALFRHPFRGAGDLVTRYMDSVRKNALRYRPRRSLPSRRRFEKAIADSWLEFSFGIRPLISDVSDLARTAIKFAYDDNVRRSVITGTGEDLTNGTDRNIPHGIGLNYLSLIEKVNSLRRHEVMWKAYLDWKRTAATGSMDRLLELSGVRLDLFIPTLYELAPWSFLVDYFSNLGTVIETGCAAQSNVSFALMTERRSTENSYVFEGVGSDILHSDLVGAPGQYTMSRRFFNRPNVTSQIPTVPLLLSFPGSATKFGNMLALWRSKVKGV